ncbi:MAG: hypothetical protein HOY71_55185 [Nonomuraea sp.]|nr:hypothetical protein [Nonomuraea sp.]
MPVLAVLLAGCAATPPPAAKPEPAKTPTSAPLGDARQIYLESMKRQAMQQQVSTLQEYYRAADGYPGGTRYAVDSAFDYRTKQARLERVQVTGASRVAWATRCDGPEEKFWSSKESGWETKYSDGCPTVLGATWINDGLGTGGLSEEQATTFSGKLGDYKGLIAGRSVRKVEKYGKPYLRLEVTVTPRRFGSDLKIGVGMYLDAFKWTDVEALKHPYGLLGGGQEGLRIVRYVDPGTLLPAYAEMTETPRWRMHRVQYSFGGPVERSTLPAVPGVPRLSWEPEGQRQGR